ncbi:hypothetical protein EVG20_g5172 [Dentipellis fragilis]|uniref:Uncharacterized protein n=1 Tax=Dentipellis fragilis TaxID=205917 RepID=A0A4Y9YW84_9AGAM|nr:hypothetical protein EVG20_g5172 [Dentipellis fragilis]
MIPGVRLGFSGDGRASGSSGEDWYRWTLARERESRRKRRTTIARGSSSSLGARLPVVFPRLAPLSSPSPDNASRPDLRLHLLFYATYVPARIDMTPHEAPFPYLKCHISSERSPLSALTAQHVCPRQSPTFLLLPIL